MLYYNNICVSNQSTNTKTIQTKLCWRTLLVLAPFGGSGGCRGRHRTVVRRPNISVPKYVWLAQLASCLIYAGHFRHTHITYVINCWSFGCVLLLNQIYLTTMCRSTISLRFIWSALEIRVRIRVKLIELHYFGIPAENNENEQLISSANFT